MPDLLSVLDKNRFKNKGEFQAGAGKVVEELKKSSDAGGEKSWAGILAEMDKFFDTQETDDVVSAIRMALSGTDKLFFSKVSNKALLSKILDTLDHKLVGSVKENCGIVDDDMKSTFSMSLRKELLEMSKFGCGDALTFAGAINEKGTGYYNPKQILNREWRRKYDARSSAGVVEAKLGICTTFAQEAKNLILSKRNSKIKRVEVVAVSNHVFVLVNRSAANHNIRDVDEYGWDDHCFVVDVWLGTLGHLYLYQGDKYGFLQNIQDIHYNETF